MRRHGRSTNPRKQKQHDPRGGDRSWRGSIPALPLRSSPSIPPLQLRSKPKHNRPPDQHQLKVQFTGNESGTTSDRREYNEKRPHRSLGLETPMASAMATSQAAGSGWATPSLRPQLEIASPVERCFNPDTNPTRLTFPVGPFG